MTAYRPRDLGPLVRRILKSMPVLALTGMRQTGKTTFLRSDAAFRDRRYLTLDHLNDLSLARARPDEFLKAEADLTIDEAQRCPELFPAVKLSVDRDRRPGRYILIGSANFLLLRRITESLAGRAAPVTLHPFNRREITGRMTGKPFLLSFFEAPPKFSNFDPPRDIPALRYDEVLTGGMPPVCLGAAEDAGTWFEGFVQSYLERDLRDLSQVADLIPFRKLMQLAALRTGQILNQSQLARDAGLKAVTAGRYLNLLEISCVISRVPPFLGNRASRIIKAPKLFFADSGLAAHLAGVTELGVNEPMMGPLFETYVAQNLASILSAHWTGARLHYWAVQGRHEVDFVIERGRDCLAVEVKWASRWSDDDLSGLEAFLAATPGCRAAILAYNGERTFRFRERLWLVPVKLLLS